MRIMTIFDCQKRNFSRGRERAVPIWSIVGNRILRYPLKRSATARRGEGKRTINPTAGSRGQRQWQRLEGVIRARAAMREVMLQAAAETTAMA